MLNDNDQPRILLPPPPLFTIRPPPKPLGSIFDHFPTVDLFNGQCIRYSININNASDEILIQNNDQIHWSNLLLRILALISVVSCLIIAIFIFICLKKLRKEEKNYKNYCIHGSISSKIPRSSDRYLASNARCQCPSQSLNYNEDYYSHQLIPFNERYLSSMIPSNASINCEPDPNSPSMKNVTSTIENSSIHPYEYISEHLLTLNNPHHPLSSSSSIIYHHRSNSFSYPYTTFSRSYHRTTTTTTNENNSQCQCSSPKSTTLIQEESSTPLLPSSSSSVSKESSFNDQKLISSTTSMINRWKKENLSSKTTMRQFKKSEQRTHFFTQ